MTNLVATLLSKNAISSVQRSAWTQVLNSLLISDFKISPLSDRAEDYFFTLPAQVELATLKNQINITSRQHDLDIAVQVNDKFRKGRRLVVFDMDSTLIQQEVIDMIAAYADVEDKVSAITALAMNGEIDFDESLRRRASLLEGVTSSVFEQLKSKILITRGAKQLCNALKKEGYVLAVLSGGFIPLASWLKDQLGLDYAFANSLQLSYDGLFLTGQVEGEIVNAERKAHLLRHIAELEDIELRASVAVGDGANDLVMMHTAGFGIAFNAKPIVQDKAPARLNSSTLQDILYYLGYSLEEQAKLIQ
ncbi:HAD-like domain-containing protein [Lipomyces japonicus]|uniref:HAD-like domain-containing protein n=1 Tax=Lipomyces japonicus TaxID=56871 RepID=UPI0034CEFA15